MQTEVELRVIDFFFQEGCILKFPFMSTVTGITVGIGSIGNQLLRAYKCINNIFYFLEKHLKQSLGPKWDGYHYLERKMRLPLQF